jgi:hypothetical protein
MKNKQTAVEYLEHQLDWLIKDMSEFIRLSLFNKAKELEKQQIIDAYDAGLFDGSIDDVNDRIYKKYYKKTYEK